MRVLRSISLIATLSLCAVFSKDAGAEDTPKPKLTTKPVAAVAASPSEAPKADATLLKVSKTMLDRAKVHQLKPKHFENIAPKDEQSRLKGNALVAAKKLNLGPKPKLDVGAFGTALHAVFKDSVRGYAMQLRKDGQPVYTLIWDAARTPSQGNKGWTLDTKMHVASVSKLITAIVAVKMLDERGLSFDTKIGPYLPNYWSKGANSADITFRKLLTHTAGFVTPHGDYGSFKGQIAAGVAANPQGLYTNGAFSIVRVLNATMTGAVPASWEVPLADVGNYKDQIWDMLTTDAFAAYADAKVFAPSGVSGVVTTKTSSSALAYSTKTDAQGADSGDLATQLGGAGFRVSVNDILNVMHTFRRAGTIVSKTKAKQALDASLGIDVIEETPAGKIYFKNGWWGWNQEGNFFHVEQAVAFFLPEEMELVMLVNSNIGNDVSLANTVRNLYVNSLH
jgi:CubicO group peptidase (beta-lactamase class C family)